MSHNFMYVILACHSCWNICLHQRLAAYLFSYAPVSNEAYYQYRFGNFIPSICMLEVC